MFIRLLISLCIGIVISILLISISGLLTDAAYSGDGTQTATLFIQGDSIDISNQYCERIPVEYQQYCDNVKISLFEQFFFKVESAKHVPSNPYVQGLDKTLYIPCLWSCSPESFLAQDDISNDFYDTALLIFIIASIIAAASYASYITCNRLFWSNKRSM